MDKERRILILGGVATGLVLVAGSLWLSRGGRDRFAGCRKSVVSGGLDQLGAPFTLTDQNGLRVSSDEIFMKPALLYFGYTYCPDVCTMDSARNAEAVAILDGEGIEVTPVFISVDPRRDTPEVLRAFVETMHPRMIGLTGSASEIDAVSKSWRNYYRLNDQQDKENYLVDHMTNTYLILPGAGTVDVFARDLPAQELADRIACFIGAAG